MFYIGKSGSREQESGNSRERPLVVPDKGKERSVPTCPGSTWVPQRGRLKEMESSPVAPNTSHPLQGLLACRRLGIEGVGVVNTIMNEKKVPSPTQRMTRTSVGNPIRFTSRAGVHRAFRKITLVKVERNGTSRIPYCFFFSLFPACPVRVSCPPCKGSLTNERKTH